MKSQNPLSRLNQDKTTHSPQRRSMLCGMLAAPFGASALLTACGGSGDSDHDVVTPETPQVPETAQKIASFGLIAMPDTQFYSRYATEETGDQFYKKYGSEPYKAQTDWIVAHAEELKVPFVLHLGDVVDQSSHEQQWVVADEAMAVLEDGHVPYSVCAGNHDVKTSVEYDEDPVGGTDTDRDLAQEPYLEWFGTDRAKKQSTFGGRDQTGFHEYHIFEAEGQRYLVLSLSWRISEQGLAWARDVLQSHSTLPTIVVSHQMIAIASDGVSPLEVGYGQMLWDKLIKSHDQIIMAIGGHHHGSSHLIKTNEYGNDVALIVVDYQMAYQGGNGLMRYMEFDLSNNEIRCLSFSPWVPQKPEDTLNQYDQALLTASNQQYVISMDFGKRFAGFNRSFEVPQASNTSLSAALTSSILANFTEPETDPANAPQNDEDYYHVASTLAHWRFFGGQDGVALPVNAVILDASGNGNILTRGESGSDTLTLLDGVHWSEDRHGLSAAPGSVVFSANGASQCFMTAVSSSLNAETFTSGYTIEAFIKIGTGWTAANNAFMNMMSRAGRRGNLESFAGSLPQSPPLQFAFSNLREVQWEVIPEQEPAQQASGGGRSSRANWSGEIMIDTWQHVAIVNDPETRETTLYIEGAPVLRNTIDTVGLASLGEAFRWTIGGGYWDGNGPYGNYLGSIGEIRIVPEPLASSQWLTARAAT